MNTDSEQIIFKLSLLGDGSVGKTSLRHRYLGKEFSTSYLATLGADFAIKEVNYENKFIVRYQIWDLAGQPRFNQLRKTFYLGSQGAIIIYDVNSLDSFRNVKNWLNEFIANNGKGTGYILLVGNKIDLRNDKSITTEEGKEMANQLSSIINSDVPFIETSAKTGQNIDDAFKLITRYFVGSIN
jgi:Ras-related protein Rab-1A